MNDNYMKPTEIIKLLHKAIPFPHLISGIHEKNGTVRFYWMRVKYRIYDNLVTKELVDGVALSTDRSSLIEHILKNYKEN